MKNFINNNCYSCGYEEPADCSCRGQVQCCPSCPPCPKPSPCPPQPQPRPQPKPPAGKAFLSSYVEAVADTHTVEGGSDVVFIDSDIVGTDITFTEPGSVFTINTPGLYSVEWNANVNGGVVMGILENGEPASAMSHTGGTGSVSSGSFINVTRVPFTLSLRTYAGTVRLTSLENFENTAASIRIVRFADGAKE